MKANFYFVSIVLLVTINACSVYTPNALNVPLLKNKNDLSVGLQVGSGGNLQAAYAISNHVGIMGNAMGVKNEVTINDNIRSGKGSLYELGLGYFASSGKNVFELYSGAGIGKVDIDKKFTSLNITRNFNADGRRIFIQPSFGRVGRNFEIAFSTRFSFVKYRNVVTTYTVDDLTSDNFANIDRPSWLFIEPALTLRAGSEKLKFQLQIGKSIKTNTQGLGYESGIFNLGLIARL